MSDNSKTAASDHLKLQAILENAVDAIITIDERGIIESVNPATQTLFQYSEDELIGQNVNILMPSPYHEEHDGYLQKLSRIRRAQDHRHRPRSTGPPQRCIDVSNASGGQRN